MDARLPGVVLAFGAAVCYGAAVALQASEARAVGTLPHPRASLLGRLVRRPRWLAGLAVGLSGWPLQGAALLFAPLPLVQATLAFAPLVILALAPRSLQESVGRTELLAAALLLAGIAALAFAVPTRSHHHAEIERLVPVVAVLGGVALAPFVWHALRVRRGIVLAACAGAAYAASDLSTKLLSDDVSTHVWAGSLVWLAMIASAAVIGVSNEMGSYRVAPASRAAPVVFALEIGLPIALAPLLTGDRVTRTGLAVIGGAALLAALVLLARRSAWGRVVGAGAR